MADQKYQHFCHVFSMDIFVCAVPVLATAPFSTALNG
jgi:hypothetical protein